MPALRNAGKNLARLREISAIVARHGFGDVLDRSRILESLGLHPRAEEAPAERRLSRAERFRNMLVELGPTFVKFGQVLSTRPDLLPADFVRELSTLQDRVPPLPLEQVQEVIEQGLGKPVSSLFSVLEPEPLASASIGQVHAAITAAGDKVVVKVQRPRLTDRIQADLDLLYYLAQFLESVVSETGVYSPTGIVEEFERTLKEELDFVHEAANVRLFHGHNEGRTNFVIPRVFDELSCGTVLTLERLDGCKITDLDPARHDREAVARNLVEGVFLQVFVDGAFHGDPHPGNLFVLPDNRIGLVDFGIVGRLNRQMQETIVILVLAIALRDADTVARLLYKVGVPDERINLGQFRTDIAEILDRYLGRELREIQSATLVNDLLALAVKYRIRVPKEYAILTKATVTIEGVVRQVYPELDFVQVALPYARKLLFERISPKSSSGGALRAMLQLQGFMNEVPLQLSQILMDLEGGKFAVNVRATELGQLVRAVRWLGIVVFSGLMASAFIIGAFFMLASSGAPWEIGGVPVLALIGLSLAAALFGGALTWTLLAGKIHKVSLRKLIGRGG